MINDAVHYKGSSFGNRGTNMIHAPSVIWIRLERKIFLKNSPPPPPPLKIDYMETEFASAVNLKNV